jgi:hypothetical protein
VTNVKQIKAAVGQRDLLAGRPPLCNCVRQLFSCENFLESLRQINPPLRHEAVPRE